MPEIVKKKKKINKMKLVKKKNTSNSIMNERRTMS